MKLREGITLSDERGMGLPELMIGLVVTSLLALGVNTIFGGIVRNYKVRKFAQELHDMRSIVTSAHCRRTMELTENDGKSCGSSSVEQLILAGDRKNRIPDQYDTFGFGRVGNLSLKVECSNDVVSYFYAKVDPATGSPIADSTIGLAAQWHDLFGGKNQGLKPFSRYSSSCN